MEKQKIDKATFGAGCFWNIELAFKQVKGVITTTVGYIGGITKKPIYENVCAGETKHAEVVEVKYDPDIITYEKLLEVFWGNHDPTTLNRQGADVGTQYRSAIFYHNEEQKSKSLAVKEKLQNTGKYNNDIVTEITFASRFYKAEEYHQQYLEKRGLPQCGIV